LLLFMRKCVQFLVIAIAVVLSGCSPRQELGLTHIPPVLSSGLNLESIEPQRRDFTFDASGSYELRYILSLRNGPGSSPDSHELSGIVAIYDSDRQLRFEESFREHLGPNQVGGTLLTFHSGSVAGPNPHALSITLQPSPGLVEHYTDLRVMLKRQPAFPVLD
jgi:hypothetical protein